MVRETDPCHQRCHPGPEGVRGGENSILFVTCGGSARDALSLMKTALEGRIVSITASVEFTRKDLRDEGKVKDLIERIQAAGSG